MSITFFPADNMNYCDANGLTGETVYTCQCVDFDCTKGCKECNETGKVSFPNYPFEANLANSNALAVLRMFGIEEEYCGSAPAEKFLEGIAFVRSLNAMGHEPLVKENETSRGKKGARIIECGRTAEQVANYLDTFEKIAMEAARRKVKIVWG